MILLGAANLAALAVLLRLLLGGGGEAQPLAAGAGAAGPAAPDALGATAAAGPTAGPAPSQRGEGSARATPEALAALPDAASGGDEAGAQGTQRTTAPASEPAPGPASAPAAARAPVPGTAERDPGPLGAPRSHAPVTRDRGLEQRLRGLVERAVASAGEATGGAVTPANTTVALCVRRLGRPGILAARNADRPLRPASNMKLVTAAAALVLLGPDAGLETRVEAAGPPVEGVLRGDLVLRAGGDPLYDPAADGRVDHLLAPLVARLRSQGLRRIEGDLVLDEGLFAAPAPGPGWPDPSQYWQEHCALAGGFSANAGCLTAVVEATRAGEPARSFVHPLHHGLARTGTVRTVASPPLDVRVGVQGVGARHVVLDGTVPASVARWTSRFAHPDPVELFGNVLAAALAEGGIELSGSLLRERRPAGLVTLATLSTPVLSLLGPINTDSNNSVADQLFLALGGRIEGDPTRAGGARATARALERLGVPSAGLVQVDGSGLSRDGRITARQLAALLDAVLAEPGERAEAFLASLAVGGETGTLAQRLREPGARGRVWAKTGFIGGTSALSGILETDSGQRLVFSILIEYPRLSGLNNTHWKPLQNDLVKELLRHG